MGRRAGSAALFLLLASLVAVPAQASTRELSRVVVRGPGLENGVEVLGSMLNGQLEDNERESLVSALLAGPRRDHGARGTLGPKYEFIWSVAAVNDELIAIREDVYLSSDPPLAFTPSGQTYELYPGTKRRVPRGWREIPGSIAAVLVSSIEEGVPLDYASGGTAEWVLVPAWMVALALAIFGLALWAAVRVLRARGLVR